LLIRRLNHDTCSSSRKIRLLGQAPRVLCSGILGSSRAFLAYWLKVYGASRNSPPLQSPPAAQAARRGVNFFNIRDSQWHGFDPNPSRSDLPGER
jgi:hypothetical protein